MSVEFDSKGLVALVVIDAAVRKGQQHESSEKQNTPCGRELFHHRPEKLFDHMQTTTAAGETFGSLGLDVVRIKAVAGAGFRLELRPQLAYRQPFRYALPKIMHARGKRWARHGRRSGRWISGRHGVTFDYRGFRRVPTVR